MSKITLTDAASLENENSFVTLYNANNTEIEAASDNFLSRDGTSPNQMVADLDMNSHRVLNLPAPLTNDEPIRLIDLQSGVGTANVISFTPAGGLSSTNVQAAIEELDTEKAALSDLSSIALSGSINDLANSKYVEGTWTPTLSAVTPPTGVTYSQQFGYYTRIGNQVFIRFRLTITSKGSGGSGNVSIGTLPFTSVNDSGGITTFPVLVGNLTYETGCTQAIGTINNNAATIGIQEAGSGIAFANAQWANVGSNFVIRGSAVYAV